MTRDASQHKVEWSDKAEEIFNQSAKDADTFDTELFKDDFEKFNDYFKHEFGEDWLDTPHAEDEVWNGTRSSLLIPSKGYIDRLMNPEHGGSPMPEDKPGIFPGLMERPPKVENEAETKDAPKFDYAALDNFRRQLNEIKGGLEEVVPKLNTNSTWVNPGDFFEAEKISREVNGEGGDGVGLTNSTRGHIVKLNEAIDLIGEKLKTTMDHYEKAEEFNGMTAQELEKHLDGMKGAIDGLGPPG